MRHTDSPAIDGIDLLSRLYERIQTKPCSAAHLLSCVKIAQDEYEMHCIAKNFDYQSIVSPPNGVTVPLMRRIYEDHLRDGSGKSDYLQIVHGDDGNQLCTYCGLRAAETADHYKEKSRFPLLSVFPANLIPACAKCNGALNISNQRFHGYYDDIKEFEWLTADLQISIDNPTPGVVFSVQQAFCDDADLCNRVGRTFEGIGLGRRWSIEFSAKLGRISKKFAERDSTEERQKLIHEYMSSDDEYPWNGPHQTLYRSILKSDWVRPEIYPSSAILSSVDVANC